jgi:RNA polymerase sigma-70 factor (ECF subfamily)
MPHLDTVHNVALGLTRDPQRAEDLVQETYLRAFAAFSQYRGGSLRAWMVSICLNTGRSDLRRARRRPHEELVDDPPERLESGADPAADAVRRLTVAAALARLTDEQRVSVVLCDMAGLTAQEAADLLGCPRGTVLARVHRGRRRLAQLLDREGVRDDV